MALPALSAGPAFEAHALLGRAVVRAASANAVISAELMNGLQTLKRSRESDSKGGRSVDWSRLARSSRLLASGNGSDQFKIR